MVSCVDSVYAAHTAQMHMPRVLDRDLALLRGDKKVQDCPIPKRSMHMVSMDWLPKLLNLGSYLLMQLLAMVRLHSCVEFIFNIDYFHVMQSAKKFPGTQNIKLHRGLAKHL